MILITANYCSGLPTGVFVGFSTNIGRELQGTMNLFYLKALFELINI